MIKRIKLWLYITCLSLRTPNWIRNTFSKICELDLDRPIETPWGELEARCSTIIFRGTHGVDFVMSESQGSPFYVKELIGNQWIEVYRHQSFISDFKWLRVLKRVHAYLKKKDAYRERQNECLTASSQGIM